MTATEIGPPRENGQRPPPPSMADLPQDRRLAVQYGLEQFNIIYAERDALKREVATLKSEIAAHKVATEAQAAQLIEMESRVNSSTIVRDQAVADRAKFEAVLISIQAQLRAFHIPHGPLVKSHQEGGSDVRGTGED